MQLEFHIAQDLFRIKEKMKDLKKYYHYAKAKKQSIFVGFLGSGRGCGNTHLTLSAANYLANIAGKKTAILDLSGKQDYRQAQIILTGREGIQNKFTYAGIVFYVGNDERVIAELEEEYEYIVLDLGHKTEEYSSLFCRCSIRILTGALNQWNTKAFITTTIGFQNAMGKGYFYSMAAFYCGKCVELYEKATGTRVVITAFEPDPFKLHGNMVRMFDGIFDNISKKLRKY